MKKDVLINAVKSCKQYLQMRLIDPKVFTYEGEEGFFKKYLTQDVLSPLAASNRVEIQRPLFFSDYDVSPSAKAHVELYILIQLQSGTPSTRINSHMLNDQDKIHVLSRAVVTHLNHILLCKALGLEKEFYFLPGGHIKHNESAETALLRELEEETGCRCQIKRLLGCLEYRFKPDHETICHDHEYSFIFEVESPYLNSKELVASPESHIELIWIPVPFLSEIDFRPEALKKLLPKWLNGRDSPCNFASENDD